MKRLSFISIMVFLLVMPLSVMAGDKEDLVCQINLLKARQTISILQSQLAPLQHTENTKKLKMAENTLAILKMAEKKEAQEKEAEKAKTSTENDTE